MATGSLRVEGCRAVTKALRFLATDPRHPGLQTHEFTSLRGPAGQKVLSPSASWRPTRTLTRPAAWWGTVVISLDLPWNHSERQSPGAPELPPPMSGRQFVEVRALKRRSAGAILVAAAPRSGYIRALPRARSASLSAYPDRRQTARSDADRRVRAIQLYLPYFNKPSHY